ncbi:hypothetical protein Tco_0722960, partial [Tanacetum coccineum]
MVNPVQFQSVFFAICDNCLQQEYYQSLDTAGVVAGRVQREGIALLDNDGQTLEALNQRVIEQSSRYLDIHYVPFENNAINGGKDVIYLKQLQSSNLEPTDVQNLLKQLADEKLYEHVSKASILGSDISLKNTNGRGEGQWRLEDRNDLGKLMPRVMRGKLEAIIDGITKSKGEKITCIIADYCMGWISKVAQKMCIRLATFCSGSAAIMALIMSVHKLLDDQDAYIHAPLCSLLLDCSFIYLSFLASAGVSGSVSTSLDGVGCIARVGTSSGLSLNNGTFPVGDVNPSQCSISAISAAAATSMDNVGVSQVHSLGGSLPYVGMT